MAARKAVADQRIDYRSTFAQARLNCEVAPILKGASEVNETVKLLVTLLNPPNAQTCASQGLLTRGGSAAHTQPPLKSPTGGILSGLEPQGFSATSAKASRSASRGGR